MARATAESSGGSARPRPRTRRRRALPPDRCPLPKPELEGRPANVFGQFEGLSAHPAASGAPAIGAHASDKAAPGASALPGLRVPPKLEAPGGAASLAPFAAYGKGSLAPWWLFGGVCESWGFNVFATELRLIAVSENATFAVLEHDCPTAVVRVSQPGYAGGPVAVASEIAWLQALRSVEGVSVVEDVPTASGFPVATIRDEGGREWVCACMRYVEGSPLSASSDLPEQYRLIGQWAARLHTQARAWNPPPGFQRFTWDAEAMVGADPRWGPWQAKGLAPGDAALLERAQQAALAVLEGVPHTPQNWGLIHADLCPENIIVPSEGPMTIIDFDDCGYSWFMYDFAAALSFREHQPDAPAMAQAWVAGYQDVAALTQEDLTCACALSMIRRLQMVGWTTNHYPDAVPTDLWDAQVPGAVACAERYLRDPGWLLA